MAALAAEHDCPSEVANKNKSAQLIRQKPRDIWLSQQDNKVLESLVLMPGVSLDRPGRHAGTSFEKQGLVQTKHGVMLGEEQGNLGRSLAEAVVAKVLVAVTSCNDEG